MKKSKCCNDLVWVSNGEEGTSYYVCNKCSKACDVVVPFTCDQETMITQSDRKKTGQKIKKSKHTNKIQTRLWYNNSR